MKIALIYDYLSEIGGVERVMAANANWLMKEGHDVKLLFSYVSQHAKKYDFFKGLKIEEISSLKINNEALKLISSLLGFNKLKKYDFDLIICYSFLSLFVSRKLKCKKAFYYLPLEFIYFPLKKRWEWANDMKRKAAFFGSLPLLPILKTIDKKWIKGKLVIANSEFTRKEIKERYGINSVLSYPSLNEVFKPKKSYKKTLDKYGIKGRFVMTAGRIIPDKKTDWLIKVISELENDICFVIVGGVTEKYENELIALAKKLGAEKRLKFVGIVEQKELADLYSASELFLFASPKEAFGLVPIEAMACGTPVVAWNDNAGPNEYVINGVNGCLAKPYDLGDFSEKARKLLNEKFKLKKRKRIINSVKKFSEKEQRKKFVEIIKHI